MADRHGVALWQGVNGFISCSYTNSHGITPGVAALTVPEQDLSRVASYGTLVITDGVGTIKLPRCRVIDVQFSGGGGSPRLITLLIADRRWMWRFGHISGNWNQIDQYPDDSSFPPDEFVANGSPYMPGTYRTAEKLLADCLAALNETNPIIQPPPFASVPASWTAENPAQAMQAICDAIGYRIVYRAGYDQVAIVPAGVGLPLPVGLQIISGSTGIDPPERPNSFQLIGGPTVWNDYLELEPVTLEANGAIVTLDRASYKPANGWGRCPPPQFGAVHAEFGPEKCALAQRHVWRTFRVRMRNPATYESGFIDIPKFGRVTDRKQIVLNPAVYGIEKDERGQHRTSTPYVIGSVYLPAAFTRPAGGVALGAFGNTEIGNEKLPNHPNIDPATGLVTFTEYMYRNLAMSVLGVPVATPASGATGEPSLYLYTSFQLRSLAGMVLDRFMAAGAPPVAGDPGCPPEPILHPELFAIINVRRSATPILLSGATSGSFRIDEMKDNLNDLKAAADHYLKYADSKYQLTATSERTYAGIHPITPDGAIQQVTWSVGGGSPATTQASRNTEHSVDVPPYFERRSREKVQNFWTKQKVAEQSASVGGGLTSPGALNELIRFGIGSIYGNG